MEDENNNNYFIKPLFCRLKKFLIFAPEFAGVAQLVEHDLAKVGVAGSSPVSRSKQQRRPIWASLLFMY